MYLLYRGELFPPIFVNKRSCYLTLPRQQNFWTSRKPQQMWQKKKRKNKICLTFALRKKNGSPSFDNANGCLCQKSLFISRNFATMATWRLTTSPLSFHGLIIFCFSISKENRLTLKAWALIRQLQCLEGIYKVIAILENTNETKTCQSNWVGLWWKVRLFARYTPENSHFCPNIAFSLNQFL